MDDDNTKAIIFIGAVVLLITFSCLFLFGSHGISKSIDGTNDGWEDIESELDEYGGTITYARTFDQYSELTTIMIAKQSATGKHVSAEEDGLKILNTDGTKDFIPYQYITFVHINK